MVKGLGLFLVSVGLMGCALSTSFAQESSNPYIYYFSDKINAFIIERADGTDTRVLGAGVMELDTDTYSDIHVKGPGWSPSGEWFAWAAATIPPNAVGKYHPYVLSVDGTRRLTLLDHLQNAQMVWAATEDVLFVASRAVAPIKLDDSDSDETRSIITTYLAVVDVSSETVIASFEDTVFSHWSLVQSALRPAVVPTNDGTHVVVSYVDYEGEDNYYGTMLLVTLGADGTITERRLDAYGLISLDGHYSEFPSVSPAGWVAYPTANSFQVENLLTSERFSFSPLTKPESIYWDDSGQFALLADDNLWLLDCKTGTLIQLRENWSLGFNYSLYDWPVWSPLSEYALALGTDSQFYVFERDTRVLTELGVAVSEIANNVGWYWFDDDTLVITGAVEPGIFVCDLITWSLQHIELDIPPYIPTRFSPDERFLAFVLEGTVIHEYVTGHELTFRPAYRGLNTFAGGEVEWHTSGDWLLIFEGAGRAGGAYLRNMGIARADGTLRRDLSHGWWPNAITLNWLPPQVDPANLTPPLDQSLTPEPINTLVSGQWQYFLEWSSDGRRLTAGDHWYDVPNRITVWDVAIGNVVHEFEISGDEPVEWGPSEAFVPGFAESTSEHSTALSPDARQTVEIRHNQTNVVDANTGIVLTTLQIHATTGFWNVEFSPDGCWLAAAPPFLSHVYIWDTNTWEVVAQVPNAGQAVAWSPDGTQLAVAASWDVQIWDVAELLAFGQQ